MRERREERGERGKRGERREMRGSRCEERREGERREEEGGVNKREGCCGVGGMGPWGKVRLGGVSNKLPSKSRHEQHK